MRRLAPVFFLALAAGACLAQDDANHALRVCADPDNMPFSRSDGSGFENRIAQVIADELKLPLDYAWLPDRRGFVRKTLGAGLCDVIMGVPVDFERTAATHAYYRSSYVLVQRSRDAKAIRSFDDPRLASLRIGVQLIGNDLAASPPGAALARAGFVDNVRGYPIAGDEPAAQRMVDALAHGDIDAAFIWGPQAGYFARRSDVAMQVDLLPATQAAKNERMDYAIGMGVRRSDRALRERLDAALQSRRQDIDRILAAYAVPRTEGARP